MRTVLRKMGNSTGVILPKAIVGQAGLAIGSAMEIAVEGEKVVLTPLRRERREGWSEAAADVALHADGEAAQWQAFGNRDDADLRW